MYSSGLSEMVLIVSDVARAAEFYGEVVGLVPEERERSEDWAWFWVGEPGRRQWIAVHKGSLLFEEHSPYPEGERWGRVHFALEVPRAELEAAVEHVRAKQVPVHGPIDFDARGLRPAAKSYYFYDPDGNLVEFWSAEAASSSGEE
jgi:catechol 2,3-dioxygenase-like lactoylglutathione lyase family enzyme